MSYSSGYPYCPQGPTFDVSQTWLAGMSQPQLAALLGLMTTALAENSYGGKVYSASYTQNTGSRAVSYSAVSRGQLMMDISMVQKALGMPGMNRRPLRPVYL